MVQGHYHVSKQRFGTIDSFLNELRRLLILTVVLFTSLVTLQQSAAMLLFGAVFLLLGPATLASPSPNFCLPSGTSCFSNFPVSAAVCGNHPWNGNPYGYIDRDEIARQLDQHYPSDCTDKDPVGSQRCYLTLYADDWSKPGHPTTTYATLWTTRSGDRQGHSHFVYGGLSWGVCKFILDAI